MENLDFFEEEYKESCPSCGTLLFIETPKLACDDPEGCGKVKEGEGEEELLELNFEEDDYGEAES